MRTVLSDEPHNNRGDPVRDAALEAVRLIRRMIDYSEPKRGKIKMTLTAEFVTFGCEGDREPAYIVLQWEPA